MNILNSFLLDCCPLATSLTDIPSSACPENIGQIQRYWFVRKGVVVLDTVAPYSNSTPATVQADPTLLSTWNILFSATDDSLESVFDEVEITVDNVNDAPVINFPDNFTFLEDESETYDFTQYISDIDNTMAELTLTWAGNVNINVALVNWNVTFSSNVPNWNGSEDITFTVDDNSDRTTVHGVVI